MLFPLPGIDKYKLVELVTNSQRYTDDMLIAQFDIYASLTQQMPLLSYHPFHR